ncbi:ABC transporter ATP-binding protein [Shimia sp. R11_0]|uniref:ABC transporter ATP-binding protein n=1 Tax=Shimia sp. R11_0 TaxID=2821096 RepID=UPI001ADAAAE3|nr:ABC transporter ATP-binding protein [Shimia sp. R11_0]MBO9477290.1 ABC transporter ATP-binding protein [Shimia sp. R11_0]
MTPDLHCTSLTKTFGDTNAVDNVSFTVPAGSFFSILGPSGCGKTTIMRMVAGFLEPTSGDIQIKGQSVLNVPPNKRQVNMVFQHLALFPMMNIAENIGYGLRRKGLSKKEIDIKVEDALDRIGLPDIGMRRVEELSGGQKQRVAIARCMVLEPDVLLLDEPLGALDLKLREHMKVELKALQAAFDTTFIYITHDQSEALVMSDKIAVMNAGRFEQVGSAQELYYQPETAFVAGFVGDSNRWSGTVLKKNGANLLVQTSNGLSLRGTVKGNSLQEGQRIDAFVRPEAIRIAYKAEELSGFDNQVSGIVSSILFNGAASRVLVKDQKGLQEIAVNLPQSGEFASLAKGAEVHIAWSSDQATCFATGAA